MGRSCRVCNSPNRNEYERLYLNGWKVKDIWKYAQTKHSENIPYHTFLYHMRHHVEEVIQSQVEASKFRKERIKDEIYKTIQISENLRKNIERVQKMIDKLTEEITPETDMKLLLALLQEARQLYKLLLDYSDKISLGPELDKDTLYDQVISCMIDAGIPDKYLDRFSKLWEQYEDQSS